MYKRQGVDWVHDAAARFRDLGHVLHVEVFVVPRPGRKVGVSKLREIETLLEDLDFQLHDIVVVPTTTIPEFLVKEDR